MSPRDWASASYRRSQAVGNSMTEPVIVGLAVGGSRDLSDGNAARLLPLMVLWARYPNEVISKAPGQIILQAKDENERGGWRRKKKSPTSPQGEIKVKDLKSTVANKGRKSPFG
ncbi:hypothetical protein KOW79_017337 [Hemibagrus wyckioides]|uniref:Uncharacterized protein n=1 Tax=Hemibagrus wyckioides TaxID=337641 RepID=A0A9D3N9J6_9TELE|nr:hypothetical protein KOW79_017337 [Hemibagrus wyckioides]